MSDRLKQLAGEHPFLGLPGEWLTVGHGMMGEGLLRFPLEGRTSITHQEGKIVNNGSVRVINREPVSIASSYQLSPTADDNRFAFYQENPDLGGLRGELLVFDERLLLSYSSADGKVLGSEVMMRLGEKRYTVSGWVLVDGHVMSAWKADMVRLEEKAEAGGE